MKKYKNNLDRNGFLKTKILSNKNIKSILKEIKKIYFFEGKKKLLDEHIKNLYRTNPTLSGKCYDMLNQSALIQKIFLSDKVLNRIASHLDLKSKSLITFADFQFLVMLPSKKREDLGWHQDSKYFEATNTKKSSLILWTSLSSKGKKVNGSLALLPGSHKNGRIQHQKNYLSERKKASRSKRGRFFISSEKLKKFKKSKNLFLNNGESLLFDSNMVHRTGPNLKNNENARYTIIARYKNIKKILNIS